MSVGIARYRLRVEWDVRPRTKLQGSKKAQSSSEIAKWLASEPKMAAGILLTDASFCF
jgi:hypothetical protein